MHWTAPGKVLIAWDSGRGPTFGYDPGTLVETDSRLYDWYEVWRSTTPDEDGADLGSTTAEAWLDVWVAPSTVYYYTVYGHVDSGGDGVQVGPRMMVETRSLRNRSADGDIVPPTAVDTLFVQRSAVGNVLKLRPSSDAESGVLAYLVYTANGAQPAYVVWVDTWDTEADAAKDTWLDRAGTTGDGYVVRALDTELNLSAAHAPVTSGAPSGFGVYNVYPNPQCYDDGSRWGYSDLDGTEQTEAEVGVSLPTPILRALRISPQGENTYTYAYMWSPSFDVRYSGEEDWLGAAAWWFSAYLYRPAGGRTRLRLVYSAFKDGEDDVNASIVLYDDNDADSGFVRHSVQLVPDEGWALNEAYFVAQFWDFSYGPGLPLEGDLGWITGLMAEPTETVTGAPAAFNDGDSSGWEWMGTYAHENPSRETP